MIKTLIFRWNVNLVFIARIPLASKTTSVSCKAMSYTDSPTTTTFVIVFPKRRNSGLDNLENAIDDKVLAAEGKWGLSDNRIDVNPD